MDRRYRAGHARPDADAATRRSVAGMAPPARRLAAALEPFAGQVYFSPECHERYERLGFGASPGSFGNVAGPDGPAYFTSRGSVMGQVPGEVVAAAFAVFNPAIVIPAVTYGWTLTDAATICAERTAGAVEQLARLLGAEPDGLARARALLERATAPLRPEGRPLYSGLLSLGLPGEPLADVWRLADLLREYRGDAHTAAWTSAGFNGTEIGLLSELWLGLPMRSYSRTRGWSNDDFDEAADRLRAAGLVDGDGLTPAGRDTREVIEATTDHQCQPLVDALGDDFDELVELLAGWSGIVVGGAGYPSAGAADLARRSGS